MKKQYIGESKLLNLGFMYEGKNTYVLKKKKFDKQKKRLFEKKVATVILDNQGYIKRTIGLPKANGKVRLYWRR